MSIKYVNLHRNDIIIRLDIRLTFTHVLIDVCGYVRIVRWCTRRYQHLRKTADDVRNIDGMKRNVKAHETNLRYALKPPHSHPYRPFSFCLSICLSIMSVWKNIASMYRIYMYTHDWIHLNTYGIHCCQIIKHMGWSFFNCQTGKYH